LSDIIPILPHVNASLNALATVLLVTAYVLIKRRQEVAHKWTMLACFAVSAVFLACYLTYHFNIKNGSKQFPASEYPTAAYAYYPILISHILLAVTVPFLAVGSIYLGLADKRRGHRRLAKWAFPIWLYVSVTGVIVYLMLYQIFTPRG
jgi:putative membrane protein